jgi:outer membrane protein OmpA-like peptidoglycan-associated protein
VTRRFKRPYIAVFGLAALLATGCSGAKTTETAASASPEAIVSAVESATPAPSPSDTGSAAAATAPSSGPSVEASTAAGLANSASPEKTNSPTPTPTPSPDPNLLAASNGTIVRSYPSTINDVPADASERVYSYGDKGKVPYVLVWELPGVATISSFVVHLIAAPAGQSPGVTIAVSTTSATDGFRDVGAAQATQDVNVDKSLPENISARWVRVTLGEGAPPVFHGIDALGTLQPRPATAPSPDGIYVEAQPYKDTATGGFVPDPGESVNPWYVRFTSANAGPSAPLGLSGARCRDSGLDDAYPGTFDGRVWNWQTKDSHDGLVVNDEATIISNHDKYYVRTTRTPKFCKKTDGGGTGPIDVLVLDRGDWSLYPMDADPKIGKPYHFDRESAAMVDPNDLKNYQMVIFNGICNSANYIAPAVGVALSNWVAAGHKLMIYDADMCGDGTDYAFLPYPFISDNPGARGAKGSRLIEVENDQFGTLDKTDSAHYFDPQPFATGPNQLGDANTVVTHDPHWCGHLFGTNANNVNGFMQMYAPYGKGLFIYGGMDHDDDGNSYFQRIRMLELASTIDGNAPCTQSVSLAFLIEPSQSAKFTPGKTISMPFQMELLANQGWKGHVNLTATGDFQGAVTPAGLDVSGGTVPLKIAVRIPANAKPGAYAVLVTGTTASGQTAQATIAFQATTPIVKQLKIQRRIRLYGIHFDVDSANIQPRSEPVIKEVAQIMREEPAWRFQIEGHTDSDGGVDHNQVLSQHRAESVVNDLVKRYRIARSRLVPVGYGLSRPVATNATPAGKALNRRVELLRL